MKLKKFKSVKGLIQYKDKFLIVKQEKFIGGEYEVPGGKKLNSKESDRKALKREIMEETGLEAEILKILNRWSMDLPKFGMHLDGKTFLCKTESNKVKLSKEHISFLWISRERLDKLDTPKWLKNAISKI
jgi:8-oxo-dGTP diphosphatase